MKFLLTLALGSGLTLLATNPEARCYAHGVYSNASFLISTDGRDVPMSPSGMVEFIFDYPADACLS